MELSATGAWAGLESKRLRLESELAGLGSALIAYSGGTDSAVLAFVAHRVLGERMLAVIADSASLPRRELAAALKFAELHGIPVKVLQTAELDDPEYAKNNGRRCFHCKDELFTRMEEARGELGFEALAYGMNADDRAPEVAAFRPGQLAAVERGVAAPLAAAGLTKAEVRELARRDGLELAEKPASACLSSRIAYGMPVTAKKLMQVEQAEDGLHDLGFAQVRVRHHGELARVEVGLEELARALTVEAEIVRVVMAAGFVEVEVDRRGYRSGSMNEGLVGIAVAGKG
ncbi:ATP-dependent sacrificial sulfur transferase LarE [Granulicella sp. 5B5]|uniref:ATP-dependent sacrificial sulfur transferase LarE n=1 Tax=Granulicella sp. 5B5 TaxID=1617967 RepID=UPI0015F44E7A|nr:ATP-dependent sacrificial sulfur transferase LarE [Granulicella sp. 5B5]QMV19270.1 ATP-dependent sacrificial sulfur transferase LarE [Granulicella sp. 5B5]